MKTLEEIRKLIKIKTCRWCDDKVSLIDSPIEHYDHSGGWNVKGFPVKQWLYIVCPKCGYQWALWKLGVSRNC